MSACQSVVWCERLGSLGVRTLPARTRANAGESRLVKGAASYAKPNVCARECVRAGVPCLVSKHGVTTYLLNYINPSQRLESKQRRGFLREGLSKSRPALFTGCKSHLCADAKPAGVGPHAGHADDHAERWSGVEGRGGHQFGAAPHPPMGPSEASSRAGDSAPADVLVGAAGKSPGIGPVDGVKRWL